MLDRDRNRIEDFLAPYRVTNGKAFHLADHDPADASRFESTSKKEAKALLAKGVDWLAEQQEMLHAQDQWGVLLIFQAMDAAGKDSTIKHVMTGVSPQGCKVISFKRPSSTELDHDYLWRCHQHAPERGQIAIFNRSYYEEVLVVRVHRGILESQKLHPSLVTPEIWRDRFTDIRNFEQYLANNGIVILKFFLNVSREEQKKRFLARLDDPEKHWKFSSADVRERQYWDDYMTCFEEAIQHTATEFAPWYVIPADNKWFMRTVVAAGVVDAIANLSLHFPKIDDEQRAEFEIARQQLESEK